MANLHMRSALDRDLAKLQANIVRISSMVEQAVDQAMLALETRNVQIAQQVIVDDREINTLRYEVEEGAMLTLALQNPRATDLRMVIAAVHIAIELERMGDHAVGIAKLVERMEDREEIESLHQLPKMAKRANKMIRLAIDSYIEEDADKARDMMGRDKKINRGYEKLYNNLITEMRAIEGPVERATWMMWMGHNLERIGDRAVNIAERVVFMVTGNLTESSTTDYDLDD